MDTETTGGEQMAAGDILHVLVDAPYPQVPYGCALCRGRSPGAMEPMELSDHAPVCPWRLGREWAAGHSHLI